MVSCGWGLAKFDPIFVWVFQAHVRLQNTILILSRCFSGMFVSCVYKRFGIIVVVFGIDLFVWIIEADWSYFGLMKFKCFFGWSTAWSISALVEFFGVYSCLLLIWSICYLVAFFLMNRGPRKGRYSNLLLWCINIYLNSLLLSRQLGFFLSVLEVRSLLIVVSVYIDYGSLSVSV